MLSSKHFFLLPALLTLVAIILFPLLFTVRVSFSSWDVFQSGLDFIGGSNYVRVFEDERFWQSLQRLSLLSIISVSLQYTLGFALALAVWKQVRGGRLLRV
jgi:multiple sugar transport system permease protein